MKNTNKKYELISCIVGCFICVFVALTMLFAPLISSPRIAESYGERLDDKIKRTETVEEDDYDYDYDYDDDYDYDYDDEDEMTEEEIEIQRDINDIEDFDDDITLKTEIIMFMKYFEYSNVLEKGEKIPYDYEWYLILAIIILVAVCILMSIIFSIIQIIKLIRKKYSISATSKMLRTIWILWLCSALAIMIQYSYYGVCHSLGLLYLSAGIMIIAFFITKMLVDFSIGLKQKDIQRNNMINTLANCILIILSLSSMTNVTGNTIAVNLGINGYSMVVCAQQNLDEIEYDEETREIMEEDEYYNDEDTRTEKKLWKNVRKSGLCLVGIIVLSTVLYLLSTSTKFGNVKFILNYVIACSNIGLYLMFDKYMEKVDMYIEDLENYYRYYEIDVTFILSLGIIINLCIIGVNIWKMCTEIAIKNSQKEVPIDTEVSVE